VGRFGAGEDLIVGAISDLVDCLCGAAELVDGS
jgi:hypothetical protein